MKSARNNYKNHLKDKEFNAESPYDEYELETTVEICLKNMLLAIDKDYDIAKYKKKCEEIDL